MPASRSVIKAEVESVLCAIARVTSDQFEESTSLKDHPFWFTSQMTSALCVPFSNIAIAHGGTPVAPSDSGKCRTVGECIDLTHAKANTTPTRAARISPRYSTITRRERTIA